MLLCVFFCVPLCVSVVLLCVSFCVSSLNRFLKHRHETDVYTPFHGLYNRRAKGIPALRPERLHRSGSSTNFKVKALWR